MPPYKTCRRLTEVVFNAGDLGAELQALGISAFRSAEELERQYALLSDFRVGVERCTRESAAKADGEFLSKRRFEVEALSLVPQIWRGRRTRRWCDPQPADERERAELAERARWGRDVLGILHDADLPFVLGKATAPALKTGAYEGCSSALHANR